MSQQSDSSSPKKMSSTDGPNAIPKIESVNPNQVLDITLLIMVNTNDLTIKKPRTSNARRPKESVRAKATNSSSSTPLEDLNKEGSRYAHNSIAKIVTHILNEQHQVPGISVSLQTIIPEPVVVTKTKIRGKSSNDDDVHIVNEDVHKDNDDEDVKEDVNDIWNTGADVGIGTATGTHVVDLDEFSDKDLVVVVNPSIAKRLMTRRKVKAALQSSPKRKSVSVGPTKSWSKVIPKKRKAQAIVNSDSDVDVNAQDIPLRKKPTTSKLASSLPEVPIDNISFHYPSSVNRWKYVYPKRIALGRELAQNVLENKETVYLIHEAGLLKTVVHFPTCYEMLVKEFIMNLSEDCADRKSKDFRKVYVRGKCVTFSSTIINNFLGRSDEARPELEVTDNKICEAITTKQVKDWPLKGKLSPSKLSIKYAMLHKIGAANWVPTNHKSIVATLLGKFIYVVGTKTKFDYGTYIFDQTKKHARSYSVKGPIAFPSIICGIIVNQDPNILSENDYVCKRESAISFHYKLFQGTHVPDIVATSTGTSKDNTTTRKADVIAMLRETCKELESRKLALERLISSLEMDEGAEFADANKDEQGEEEGESEREVEKEVGQDDDTDEDSADAKLSTSESED
ncbi:uncharacterized protein LOC131635869 [Vicia villosa]|uniref:uncharacterized protein LOC131635869 n=1 Tax=Vicia villosa TaxID=3911 RepID=UPI00273B4757|nr:uncharacterized protein LOC131635869 [Vicia villosa]